jgi:tetratricopeptide (TPR) repeat protein
LEYDLARALGKPVYVFVTGAGFPADPHEAEDEEKIHLQETHRQALMGTGQDYLRAASREDIDQKVRSLQFRVEALVDELTRTDEKVVATGTRPGQRLAVIFAVVLAVLATVGYLVWQGEKQRKEAQTVELVQTQIAERLLDKLLLSKDISADEAQRQALAELPAQVGLPLEAIQNLIDGKISARLKDASLSPLERAKAALAAGNYDAVFVEAAKQRAESRELAILEGTAALAQFRGDPKPAWNEKALSAFQRALALSDATAQPMEWASAAVRVAFVLKDLARYAEAEPLLREALTWRESKLAPNDLEIATALNNLAELLRVTNRLAEAEPLMRRALTIDEAAYGPEHPDVARALNNLAQLLQATNRLAEAEPLMRRALAIDEAAYGPKHPDVARDLNNLASLLQATNRLAEAEPLMRRVVSIVEKSLGAYHPNVTISLNNLASLLQATHRLAEAEPLSRRMVGIFLDFTRRTGHEHPHLRTVLANYAGILKAMGRSKPKIQAQLRALQAKYGVKVE